MQASETVKGFSLMREQLGTLYGDQVGSFFSEAVLQPRALRYLLSSAISLIDVKKVGEEKVRELRALASTLDLLVSGRISMAGDESSAASRYLELVPMEPLSFAQSLAVKNAKNDVKGTG